MPGGPGTRGLWSAGPPEAWTQDLLRVKQAC